ncbi:hypothetical protein Bbelb_375960 [Branchiostoma belcheri]|nr:hypothetical protein Bbelb_375960 [Branchiostoma belcheri]
MTLDFTCTAALRTLHVTGIFYADHLREIPPHAASSRDDGTVSRRNASTAEPGTRLSEFEHPQEPVARLSELLEVSPGRSLRAADTVQSAGLRWVYRVRTGYTPTEPGTRLQELLEVSPGRNLRAAYTVQSAGLRRVYRIRGRFHAHRGAWDEATGVNTSRSLLGRGYETPATPRSLGRGYESYEKFLGAVIYALPTRSNRRLYGGFIASGAEIRAVRTSAEWDISADHGGVLCCEAGAEISAGIFGLGLSRNAREITARKHPSRRQAASKQMLGGEN